MSLRTSGEQRIPREVRGIFLHVLYYLYGVFTSLSEVSS
jgi:hypothetical protein